MIQHAEEKFCARIFLSDVHADVNGLPVIKSRENQTIGKKNDLIKINLLNKSGFPLP